MSEFTFDPEYSFMFLGLPVLLEADYPERLYETAENCGVDVKDIAEVENAKKEDRFGVIWLHRDEIESIKYIMMSTKNQNYSVIQFADGELLVITIPHNELVQYIDYFIAVAYIDEPEPEPNPKVSKTKKTKNEIRG